jgi:uncharacterized membrane protein (UPF0127 family)
MSVLINGKTLPAEYLSTPKELETGMAGRESLEGCMVFDLGKGIHTFHMKDCIVPLDIVFIQNNRITHIFRNCEPCEGKCEKNYKGIGDQVIEVLAGGSSDWSVGDKIKTHIGTKKME